MDYACYPAPVVTGHDERGVSVFAADGPVPVVRTAPDGEVVLVLDDSETVLRAGDVVVQRGTSHRCMTL